MENQDIECLDPYAKDDNTIQYDQPNPFYLSLNGSLHEKTQLKFLMEEYSNVYILTTCDDIEKTESNLKCISLFYKKDSEESELIGQKNLVTLVSAPICIILLESIRKGILTIGKDLLENFNHACYELNKKELVFLMLETTESNVKSWIKLHQSENNFDKFIKKIIFRNYYGLKDNVINKNIIDSLNKVKDFQYWQNESNCRISGNDAFDSRKFNLYLMNKWNMPMDKIEKELERLINGKTENKTNSNYPLEMINPNITSPNDSVEDYVVKFKTNALPVFYKIIKPEDLMIQKESIEELLINPILNEKEKYYLICNVLSSKKYCHYVLNNRKILEKNEDLLNKFKPTFRYVIGYAWLSLYMEESIRKSRIKQSDRFVFDLETASMLPVFPFCMENPYLNPYFSLPVSEKLINSKTNINSISSMEGYSNGIVDLHEFRRRINIFMSGRSNKDLLDGADWSNMVITGGIMAAVMPKTNPLMALFRTSETNDISDKELNRFFEEYYAASDIDVACNHKSIIDFIEHVKSLADILRKNLNVSKSDVRITSNKSAAIYINETILKEKCQKRKIPFDFDYICSNLQQNDVKFYFYELYLEKKKGSNINNMDILGDKIKENEYFNIINYCEFDKISIVINDYGFEKENLNFKNPDHNSGIEMVYYVNENEIPFIMISETLKFNISSIHLKHQLEVFKLVEEEFFSCVGRFHLPCVRSYYNGTTCYLTPSAISAYMTLTNINYKYFVGKSSPTDIVDKYRSRGYSTILNNYEIKQYISFILSNEHFKKKYDVENISDIRRIVGSLDFSHPLFKPRKYIPENFKLDPSISLDYSKKNLNAVTAASITKYYSDKYRSYPSVFINKPIYSYNGEVKPFEPWMIDVGYSYLN